MLLGGAAERVGRPAPRPGVVSEQGADVHHRQRRRLPAAGRAVRGTAGPGRQRLHAVRFCPGHGALLGSLLAARTCADASVSAEKVMGFTLLAHEFSGRERGSRARPAMARKLAKTMRWRLMTRTGVVPRMTGGCAPTAGAGTRVPTGEQPLQSDDRWRAGNRAGAGARGGRRTASPQLRPAGRAGFGRTRAPRRAGALRSEGRAGNHDAPHVDPARCDQRRLRGARRAGPLSRHHPRARDRDPARVLRRRAAVAGREEHHRAPGLRGLRDLPARRGAPGPRAAGRLRPQEPRRRDHRQPHRDRGRRRHRRHGRAHQTARARPRRAQ